MHRISGFFLLVTGWLVALSALALLRGAALNAFIVVSLGVGVFGFGLVIRTFLPPPSSSRRER